MAEHDELGLFDEPARARVPRPRQPATAGGRAPVATNDMDIVEEVLATARGAGYVLVAERVHRDGPELVSVGEFEAAVVAQLLDTGLLRLGRAGRDGVCPIEVPDRAKALATRLRAYRRPASWGPRRGVEQAQR